MGEYSWLVPIAVAMVTALGTYLAVIRRTSGRVGTTEAAKLWDEASSLRQIYLTEISRLRTEIESQEDEIERYERLLKAKQETINRLKSEIARLRRRIEKLENHAAH